MSSVVTAMRPSAGWTNLRPDAGWGRIPGFQLCLAYRRGDKPWGRSSGSTGRKQRPYTVTEWRELNSTEQATMP